jgi:hypothetical protein
MRVVQRLQVDPWVDHFYDLQYQEKTYDFIQFLPWVTRSPYYIIPKAILTPSVENRSHLTLF